MCYINFLLFYKHISLPLGLLLILKHQRAHKLRTLTKGGSFTVQLYSCLTGLYLTKQVKLLFIQHKQSSCMQLK